MLLLWITVLLLAFLLDYRDFVLSLLLDFINYFFHFFLAIFVFAQSSRARLYCWQVILFFEVISVVSLLFDYLLIVVVSLVGRRVNRSSWFLDGLTGVRNDFYWFFLVRFGRVVLIGARMIVRGVTVQIWSDWFAIFEFDEGTGFSRRALLGVDS